MRLYYDKIDQISAVNFLSDVLHYTRTIRRAKKRVGDLTPQFDLYKSELK